MMDARDAMTTWMGVLARGGILYSELEEQGVYAAVAVLGEEPLEALRVWFNEQSEDVAVRERAAALETCIWMAHADRVLADEERELLQRLIIKSELPAAEQERLEAAMQTPPDVTELADRLTHPSLRKLMLALAWELAEADGRVDETEVQRYEELASLLGVSNDDAEHIRISMERSRESA